MHLSWLLLVSQAEVQPPAPGDVAAQHAAAVAAATAVLNEASASALADVIAAEGISEEQRAMKVAEERQKRMQHLLYAITVLASSSGKELTTAPHTSMLIACSCSAA